MTIIFGASGHAKEIEYFLRLDNRTSKPVVDYFISNDGEAFLNDVPVITEERFIALYSSIKEQIVAYIGIGSGTIRKKIFEKFCSYQKVHFYNHTGNLFIGDLDSIKIGLGNIFFPSTMLTTNINIGVHNHFNLNTSISHDCIIGDYNTFSPGTLIAGNVKIGNNNFFGLGSKVIDKIIIKNDVILGAGSVVINDILEPGTYVGIPARKVR